MKELFDALTPEQKALHQLLMEFGDQCQLCEHEDPAAMAIEFVTSNLPRFQAAISRYEVAPAAGAVDLEDIEERANAASPGPWENEKDNRVVRWDEIGPHRGEAILETKHFPASTGRDCEFIANARQDIPALICEVRALRATLARINAPQPAPPAEAQVESVQDRNPMGRANA